MALPIEPVRLDTRLPFCRAEARAAGLSPATLRSGQFQRIFYDAYVAASVPITTRLRAVTALKIAVPGAFVSHHTAAELWGGVVPTVTETHLTVPRKHDRLVRQGVRSHVTSGAEPVTFRGLPMTSPTQTFLDLAGAGLNLVELVVLGDSLVKAKRTTPQALIDAAIAWGGSGARMARRAARFVREGVDSPMESRLRMLIVLAGLPEPRVGRILRGADGHWRRRFDLSYDEYCLLVEYDGRQHAENTQQWLGDMSRSEELDRLGLRIIIVTAEGIFDEPLTTLRRVRRALVDRGAPVRRQFAADWQRYFGPR